MAHVKRNKPEFPTEAYQFAETHHLGSPLKMYKAHFTAGPLSDSMKAGIGSGGRSNHE